MSSFKLSNVVLGIFIFASTVRISYADKTLNVRNPEYKSTHLRCLECSGVKSESECSAIGIIRACTHGQDACEIEIREHEGWGGGIVISKQCKQSRACDNNHVQNPRDAWSPTQCNLGKRNSVCRCCCFTDLCNTQRGACFGQVICPNPPSSIHNGMVSCSNGRLPGSYCSSSCNVGKRLLGTRVTYCTPSGQWSHPFPSCVDIMCHQRIEFRNGWYSCSYSHFVNSVCRGQCRPGFILHGLIQSTCMLNGRWSSVPPFCVPVKCPKFDAVDGGNVTCSRGRIVQSRCRVTCNDDRTMGGHNERHCQDNGEWSHNLPICKEISCPRRKKLQFGSTSCTKSWKATSVCRYSCKSGYNMKGDDESICLKSGKWSSPLPLCKRIMCPPRGLVMFGQVRCSLGSYTGSKCRSQCNSGAVLVGEELSECSLAGTWSNSLPVCERLECSQRTVVGGRIRCTDRNYAGSRCTVTCDKDKALSGPAVSVCDGRLWSQPLAECKQLGCPPRAEIHNGIIRCSDDMFIGSECSVTCNPGMKIVGRSSSTCTRSRRWNLSLPSCVELKCPDRRKILGGNIRCSNGNIAGSVCSFSCNFGRYLVGPDSNSCLNSEEWNAEMPICERVACPLRRSIDFGTVQCSDSSYYGSVCRVQCLQTHELVGNSSNVCLITGEWDNNLPFCRELTCPSRGSTEYGSVMCTDGNRLNSVCVASCNEGYTLVGIPESECLPTFNWSSVLPLCEVSVCPPRGLVVNGEVQCDKGQRYSSVCSVICDFSARLVGIGTSECTADGDWSEPLPTCEIIQCEDQGELVNGEMTCTNGNMVQSTCSFKCVGKDYELYPGGRNRNVCQRNERWSIPKPCCSRSCPPYALIDLVVVLDSSSSIGSENWIMLMSFVEGILRSFIVDSTAANFAIIRFNNIVDVDSQIFLNSYPDDIDALIKAFNKFEYNGSGTKTGNALNHARTVSLAPENGNRMNVKDAVFVITDGAASDDVIAPAEALRGMGVTILVLGIQPPKGFLDLRQLQAIAGDDSNLVIAETGFSGLTREFGLKLSRTICGEPCD